MPRYVPGKSSHRTLALCCLITKSWTPWTVARQAPLSIGLSRQECWSGLPFPPPGDLPNPGIRPRSPALQAGSLPQSRLGSLASPCGENGASRLPGPRSPSSGSFGGNTISSLLRFRLHWPQAGQLLPGFPFKLQIQALNALSSSSYSLSYHPVLSFQDVALIRIG